MQSEKKYTVRKSAPHGYRGGVEWEPFSVRQFDGRRHCSFHV